MLRFPVDAESHGTVPLPGVFQGLRWIFESWDIEEEAEAMFTDAPADKIFEDIDDIRYPLYRTSLQGSHSCSLTMVMTPPQ